MCQSRGNLCLVRRIGNRPRLLSAVIYEVIALKPVVIPKLMRFLFLLVFICSFWSTATIGQQKVIALADQGPWNAIGRVNRGGFSSTEACTGALVAPDLVLTAKHCVPPAGADPDVIRNIVFVAGWNRGEYAASSPAAKIMVHPDHIGGPLTVTKVAADVALIRLAEPITNVPYLPIWTESLPERVGFVAYAHNRLHAPAISSDCFNVRRAEAVHYIACGVAGGNSGAPMLVGLPDDPHVAGTIAARSRLGALASVLHPWAIEIITNALQEEPSK